MYVANMECKVYSLSHKERGTRGELSSFSYPGSFKIFNNRISNQKRLLISEAITQFTPAMSKFHKQHLALYRNLRVNSSLEGCHLHSQIAVRSSLSKGHSSEMSLVRLGLYNWSWTVNPGKSCIPPLLIQEGSAMADWYHPKLTGEEEQEDMGPLWQLLSFYVISGPIVSFSFFCNLRSSNQIGNSAY